MQLQQYYFDAADGIPNSPLPLLFIPAGLAKAVTDGTVEDKIRENGWSGTWVLPVFDFWHYHTTGHEVLVGFQGSGRIGFGGNHGHVVEMTPGDLVLIPAGVGHKRLDSSSDFAVLGAYPPGQDGTIVRAGDKDLDTARNEISRLELPKQDPVTGRSPGLLELWSAV
jgi:uncharacterized protein YjlB